MEESTVHELAQAIWINVDNLKNYGFFWRADKWDEQLGLIQTTLEEIAERTI